MGDGDTHGADLRYEIPVKIFEKKTMLETLAIVLFCQLYFIIYFHIAMPMVVTKETPAHNGMRFEPA